MAGACLSCGGFQDLSFAFQDWKYTDKRHKWKEKVQKNAQFPFCGQTKAFRYEIVFRGIQACSTRQRWCEDLFFFGLEFMLLLLINLIAFIISI